MFITNNNDETHYGFRCETLELCVDFELVCNGKTDCIDGSDEKNCTFRYNTTTASSFLKGTNFSESGSFSTDLPIKYGKS